MALVTAGSRRTRRIVKVVSPYLYLLPSFVFLVAFVYYPIGNAANLSLFRWGFAHKTREFSGVSNYVEMLSNPLFWQIVRNNLVYAVGTLVPSLGTGFFLAVLLNTEIRLKAVYRAIAFCPYILPMAAVSMIWTWLYIPLYGPINTALEFVGLRSIDWLGDGRVALFSLMIVAVWKFTGYYMLLFLAGLQAIPTEYYEVARLEGASFWQRLRYITVPVSSPTIFFVGMIFIINSFQSIDQVYIMTAGGPGNATNLLVFYIYQQSFRFVNMGMGATVSCFLFAILIGLALIYFSFLEKQVHYET